MPSSLSVFGAGRLGQTLSKLWHDSQFFEISQIYSRQPHSRQSAKVFIGLEDEQCPATLSQP